MKVVSPESVGLDSSVLENVRSYLEETYVSQGKYVGTLTLVARKGEIAYLDALGFMDRENQRPMQIDTIFRIYSMTKAVTSIAVMQLLEQSKFRLDDPVYWYIPSFKDLRVFQAGEYPNFITSRPKRHMSIRDLLTHMSGLTYGFMYRTNVDSAYRKINSQSPKNLDDFIEAVSKMPLEFSPGDKWNYSISTDVLGYLVEQISGLKLDEYFKKYIFEPLGMVDTDFTCPKEKLDRLASLYEHNPSGEPRFMETPALDVTYLSGGGGLFSTMSDYYQFASMLLNQGELNGKRIIGRKTIELMTTNHLPDGKDLTEMSESAFSETPYAGVGFGLGFSVMLDPAKSQTLSDIGEFGWGGMASTVFFINPKEDMLVIFMTQLIPSSTYQVRRELRSLIYSALRPE
ncbi:MAG: serine hydrolase [Flavobacteriaceae bacterium]|nr:serine hydrolase [Flavobacteriaceae bacterium]